MKKFAFLVIAQLLAAFTVAPAEAAGPSFSCARATAPDERTICRSPALRAADARMAALYHDIQHCTAMGGHGTNLDDQRAWLGRRADCGRNSACIARLYRGRIAEFAPMAAKARHFLLKGECPNSLE